GTGLVPGVSQRATSCGADQALTGTSLAIVPPAQYAVRDKRYKLVQNDQTDCSAPLSSNAKKKPYPWAEYKTTTVRELYDLKPTSDNPVGLDQPDGNFLKDCPKGQDPETCLPESLRGIYQNLATELDAIVDSGKPAATCRKK